jgi:hypothetical protein
VSCIKPKGSNYVFSLQGVHGPWKSWKILELKKTFPELESPGKSVEVLESPGINFLNLQLCQH